MITAELRAHIVRLYTVDKWRIHTIARQLGVHHCTVERVLREQQQGQPVPLRRPSLVDPYWPFLQETLSRYPGLTAQRLYQMVQQRGYRGSSSHFRSLVARLRPPPAAEAYLRLATMPGEQGQVDWAYFGKHQVGRAHRSLWAFVLVLSYSRMLFVRFYLGQVQSLFLQGHQAAFDFFGGVPRVLLYDNLKSAVLERVGAAIRFHPVLWDFATAYGFEPRPVAVARGNQKGRVERAIQYLRTAFWPARTFGSLAELNQQALVFCQQEAPLRRCPQDRTLLVRDVFEKERPALRALPDVPYPTPERLEVKVPKTPYVRFDKNDYSVPHTLVRKLLVVEATEDRVRVLEGGTEVASHPRSWDQGATIEDPAHLQALRESKQRSRTPQRLLQMQQQFAALPALLERWAARGLVLGRALSHLERLRDLYGPDALAAALAQALQDQAPDSHAVQLLLDQRAQQQSQPPPATTPLASDSPLRHLVVTPHALATYDTLLPQEADDE